MFYKNELALASSVSSHPDTAARGHTMFLGETGLVAHLRSLNPGRPVNLFDVLSI